MRWGLIAAAALGIAGCTAPVGGPFGGAEPQFQISNSYSMVYDVYHDQVYFEAYCVANCTSGDLRTNINQLASEAAAMIETRTGCRVSSERWNTGGAINGSLRC